MRWTVWCPAGIIAALILLPQLLLPAPVRAIDRGWAFVSALTQAPVFAENCHYLMDPDGNLTVEDIMDTGGRFNWIPATRAPIFLGETDDVVWVRIPFRSRSNSSGNWILNVDWPFFHQIDLFVHPPGADGIPLQVLPDSVRTGNLTFALEFFCPANGERILYLRLSSTAAMLIPIRIWAKEAYHRMALYRNMFLGVFFGILGALCAYNASLHIFTRDTDYSYYSFYVLTIILYSLSMTGVGPSYIWSPSGWIASRSYGLFSCLSFLAATLFIRNFLSIKKVGGWLLTLSNLAMVFWMIMSMVYVVSDAKWLIAVENFGALATCIAGLATTITLWHRGDITAKYLTIAWSLLIIATFVLMLGIMGFIDYIPVVQHSQSLGFIMEVLFLSLALAERINRERAEKEAAQELTVRLHSEAGLARERELTAQAKTLEVERNAKAELKQKVAQQTRDLQEALSALQAANRKLGLQNKTDGLTRIFNRRYFDDTCQTELKRARRHGQPLSLILGDIDHFKAINDTFGHRVGDECLKKVARIFKAQVNRAEDTVARYGGEEFVALLPGTTCQDAAAVAERIRRAVETAGYTHGDRHIRLTVSLGVAGLRLDGQDSIPELTERADQAMYQAKARGRNQVRTAHDQ